MTSRRIKQVTLWAGLLSVSLLLHFLVSWKTVDGIGLNPSPASSSTDENYIELSVAPDDKELEKPLLFEEPISFEVPKLLLASNAVSKPTIETKLSLRAAAGGNSTALGLQPQAIEIPLTQGVGSAGFGAGIGNGLSQSTHQFAAYVQQLRETGLDVVFVVDSTGSMDWVITETAQRIVDIVDSVRSLVPIARFGVVAYRDFDDPEYITRIQPLTFSLTKLTRFLNGLEAKGGGNWQEAISAALMRAFDNSGWRVGAGKVVILVGDAPPHEENFNKILSDVEAFSKQGGQVSSLDVSHDSNPALLEASLGRPVNKALYRNQPMFHFQAIADAGDGKAATMDGDVQITRQLLNLIMGGQFANEMGLLLDGI